MSDIIPQMVCKKCGNEYPATPEYFRRYGASVTSPCKKCIAQTKRTWRYNNPDKVASSKKRTYQRHKAHYQEYIRNYHRQRKARGYVRVLTFEQREQARLRAAEWYAGNKSHARQTYLKYYAANTGIIKSRIKDYLRRNPDKKSQFSKVSTQNRRARVLAAEGTFTAADIRLQYRSQRGHCWHCGKPVGDEYHVDHLRPLAKDGSNDPRNLVVSCAPCNLSKGDRQTWEWNGRLF